MAERRAEAMEASNESGRRREEEEEEEDLTELNYMVSRISDEVGQEKGVEVPAEVIKYVMELTEGYMDEIGRGILSPSINCPNDVTSTDMIMFAKHAKRSVVQIEDVRLCARRNPSLTERIDSFILSNNLKSKGREKKEDAKSSKGMLQVDSD
eukprot:767428-Hanusia_phi.AAC.2